MLYQSNQAELKEEILADLQSKVDENDHYKAIQLFELFVIPELKKQRLFFMKVVASNFIIAIFFILLLNSTFSYLLMVIGIFLNILYFAYAYTNARINWLRLPYKE